MLTEFKLPELGENITGGTAVKVAVRPGDQVKKDQTLIELETDKATIEVPAEAAGVVQEVLVKEGDVVKVGQTIVKVDAGATAAAPAADKAPAPSAPASAPAARQATAPAVSAPVAAAPAEPAKDVAAAPSVRRFAREIGVDLTLVPGSGPGGRISKDDVKAYAKQIITQGPATGGGIASKPLPDFSKWGAVERKAMNNIRRKTAEHLTYAWQTIPHVTQFDKVDITDLEALRKRQSKAGRKLTITPFLMKVVAAALKNFPQFNASVDMNSQEIVLKKYYHIGVAVDTENGLLVPVIRDVDQKSIFDLAEELNVMAEKARNRKLSLEDMQGGTFTITNLGGIGGTSFTPIVNSPEVAILGVSRGRMEPNYKNGEGHCLPSLMLPLSLSYDHRVIDGADGARFLRWIVEAIEQPFMLNLEGK